MSNPLFDNAPEYDSDLDTLADFVIEPTTAHVPPPPSPAPNTCLCGRTTRDDDSDEPLYCSETCARLDAFHALTARSRSNSLAPTPITTAPATPLFPHAILRESLAGFFSRPDSTNTPASTPLSATSFASVDNVPLPIEMSSHYRRVTAKRERMEWERSRSHSRTHSRARPSLSELEEEHQVETHVERENGSDGEDLVPALTSVHVHVAVDVQVVQNCAQADGTLDADQLSHALSVSMLDPAPGVSWRDPFADPAASPTREMSIAPDSHEHHPLSDAFSITESVEDFSPFNTYAPAVAHPSVLPSRKSSVCFAGVGPAGRILSAARSRAQSDARRSPVCELSEKPLPLPPVDTASLESKEVSETPIESPAAPSEIPCESCSSEGPGALPSPGLTLDLPSPMPSFEMTPDPYTPASSTAPESPCTPSGRSSASSSRTSAETPKRSPPVSSRPAPSAQRRGPRRFQTVDSVPRATIFSMVLDPEFDVTSGNPTGPGSASAQLKRVDTAPELNMGRDSGVHSPAAGASISPETPHKQRTRARATSTPRRPADSLRERTSSTPMHPGMLQLATKAPRRGWLHAPPPPTPPVSPSDVSSPRPLDPGTWQSFGAAFDALGLNSGMSEGEYQLALDEQGMGFHRRQESGESTGSSATDASWSSSYGAPPSNSSVYSWPVTSGATSESENDAYARLRARSPAASSVRTIVPPPRGSSLVAEGDGPMDHVHLHLGHSHRSRRQSSIAALDNILAMEDTFWADPIVVRDAEDSMESEDMSPGVQFGGDANGFAFPATKSKPMFEPTLRIAGLSRPPSVANLRNPNSDNSGLRVRRQSSTAKSEYLAPPTLDQHAHRTSASNFPVSPSVASSRPSPEVDVAASPLLTHLSTSLFDGPFTSSPVIGTPALSRGSPALPSGSPISAHFSLRTPSSPYLSVPSGPSRRTSRSTDASSVLLRTASAARLAAALNAAPDVEDEEALRRGREDTSFARYSPRMGHRANRSGSLARSGSAGSSTAMGLGLALGGIVEHDSRARSYSEPWVVTVPGVASGTVSRSGSRMNLMDPSVLAVPEEEEEEDYGQVVPASKFSGIAVSPIVPSMEDTGEASPLIDAFPHPMGGYFPGSRYASRANTPVKGLHTSNSALSLRQVAIGNASQENAQNVVGQEDSGDEDEEIVTTVQRMRHSMQLLATA